MVLLLVRKVSTFYIFFFNLVTISERSRKNYVTLLIIYLMWPSPVEKYATANDSKLYGEVRGLSLCSVHFLRNTRFRYEVLKMSEQIAQIAYFYLNLGYSFLPARCSKWRHCLTLDSPWYTNEHFMNPIEKYLGALMRIFRSLATAILKIAIKQKMQSYRN